MSENGTANRKSSRSELIENAIRKHANLVFRTAYQSLGNYHDAQDILGEVSLALVRFKAPLDDDVHLRNWLVRVTLNKCRDLKKSAWRRQTQPITEDIPMEAPNALGVIYELQRLDEKYRNVLFLYYYEAFTIDEIAVILGKSRNTVATRLRRGRQKLKEILTEGGLNDVY